MSKRGILLFFFFAFLAIFLSTQKVQAYYEPSVGEEATRQKVFEENVFGTNQFNQESHAYSNVENLSASLNNIIAGCQTDACNNVLLGDSGGAIGTTKNLIAEIYANPAASSTTYLADLGERLNLVQPAYAQNSPGFSGLRPLLTLWRNFRNVAYLFFVLVFIFIGFAIMFRIKISPQAVVTIQSAIPKAVMALILVTFSYAIAGLMIDLMYLITGIMLAIINPQSFLDNVINFLADLGLMGGHENFNILTFSIYFWGKTHSVVKDVGSIFSPLGFLPDTIKSVINVFPGSFVFTRNLLIELILSIIMLFVFFKIFLGLIVCYVKIIINIIIAPIRLMLGAIPGYNSFGSWIKDLTVNLLPFPIIISMLALAGELTKIGEKGFLEEPLWIAPIIRPVNVIPEFAESTIASYVGSILAFGVLLLTARVPDIIKGVFEKGAFEYGTAIKERMGAPFATGGKIIGTAGQLAESAGRLRTAYNEFKLPTTRRTPESRPPTTSGAKG